LYNSRTDYNFTTFDFATSKSPSRDWKRSVAEPYVHLSTLIYITVARTHCPSYNFQFVTPSSTSIQKGGRYRLRSIDLEIARLISREYSPVALSVGSLSHDATAALLDTGSGDDRVIN